MVIFFSFLMASKTYSTHAIIIRTNSKRMYGVPSILIGGSKIAENNNRRIIDLRDIFSKNSNKEKTNIKIKREIPILKE